MSAIKAKLNALMNKMSNKEIRNQSAHQMGIVEGGEQKSIIDEGLDHECPYQVEETQFFNGIRRYNFKPNTNLPNHYTPSLRNHEKLSYGSEVQQDQRPYQNFQ